MKKLTLIVVLSFLYAIFFTPTGVANGSAKNDNAARFAQQKGEEPAYDLSTILVQFNEGVTKDQRAEVANQIGGTVKDENNDGIDDRYQHILGGRLAVLNLQGEEGKDLASHALQGLQNHPFIEHATYNYFRYTALNPNDPLQAHLWSLNNTGQTGGTVDADIDAPEGWDISTGDSEVVVGVIDTGIDYSHEDLAANIWTNAGEVPGDGLDNDGNGFIDDVHGINAITGSGDPMDDHYHGTHCAGTIGGVGNNGKGIVGVNWSVKLIGMKFLNSSGVGLDSDAIKCLDYAIDLKQNRGINLGVLSNSWGGGPDSPALKDAISAANDAGILFVAAAGNDSADNDIYPFYPASYDVPNILAVASTDDNDNLSHFSNYGAFSVDLGAPGSYIYSTFPGNAYTSLSGTSMAAPHVSGAATLLLSVKNDLSVAELKDYLMTYADPLQALSDKCVSGRRLNTYNSLTQIALLPNFKLSADTTAKSVNQGQTASFNINIDSVSGFSDPVTFTVSSVPDINDTISFEPNPGMPGSLSTMNVVTSSTIDPKEYLITVTGVSGTITKKATLSLEVKPENCATVTYSNPTNFTIQDYDLYCNWAIESPIEVPDSLNVWKITAGVDIIHPAIGDLIVKLSSPAGTEAILHNLEGEMAQDIHGSYIPTEFKDEDSQGTWKLSVCDKWLDYYGYLDNWTLTVDGIPPGPDNQPPTVAITAPVDGSIFGGGEAVEFTGSADDPEDGDISSSIEWTSSIDGSLGNGASLSTVTLSLGTHTITASVTDSGGLSASDAIMVTVNNPPVAKDDYYTTNQNTLLSVVAPGVLGNDTDDVGDILTALLATGPSNGSLALGSDGSFTYTPDAGFTGTDSFTYRAGDGLAESNEATATINVNSANNPPTAAFSWVDGGKMKAEFTDLSTDDGAIVSWSWDFGDGKSNAAQNPKHKYHSAGPHTVTLTVTDDGGLTAKTTQTISF